MQLLLAALRSRVLWVSGVGKVKSEACARDLVDDQYTMQSKVCPLLYEVRAVQRKEAIVHPGADIRVSRQLVDFVTEDGFSLRRRAYN